MQCFYLSLYIATYVKIKYPIIQNGGYYYRKYMKYKNKYMMNKKILTY